MIHLKTRIIKNIRTDVLSPLSPLFDQNLFKNIFNVELYILFILHEYLQVMIDVYIIKYLRLLY